MRFQHKLFLTSLVLLTISICSYAQDSSAIEDHAYSYVKSGNKYVISVNDDADLLDALKEFCVDQNIKSGIVSGLGTVEEATLRLSGSDMSASKYTDRIVYDKMVITGLTGSISLHDNELALQVHATLVRPDYSILAGRLTSAIVSGSSEIIVEKLDADIAPLYAFSK